MKTSCRDVGFYEAFRGLVHELLVAGPKSVQEVKDEVRSVISEELDVLLLEDSSIEVYEGEKPRRGPTKRMVRLKEK